MRVGPFAKGVGALKRGRETGALFLLSRVKGTVGRWLCTGQKQSLLHTESACTLVLEFPASRIVSNKFLLLKLPVCGILSRQLEVTNTES